MASRCLRTARSSSAGLALTWLLASPALAAPAPAAPGAAPAAAPGASAAVEARFDLKAPDTGPFPSDLFTVADATNLSGRRMNLPQTNCTMRPSDCNDVAVLNDLDGFNLQPRLKIPFTGAIDVATVNSQSVQLVELGDASTTARDPQAGKLIGINQIVFDPTRQTLFVESDALLEQHTSYALLVTNEIKDSAGNPIGGRAFHDFLAAPATPGDPNAAYRAQLQAALVTSGLGTNEVVAASVFTTQSATAVLEKIRQQIRSTPARPARFNIADDESRAVFPFAQVASLTFERQVDDSLQLRPTQLSLDTLRASQRIGTLAFGSFSSPNFLAVDLTIPVIGTRQGQPQPQGTNQVFFNLFLPTGARPANGWPIAIFGHGLGGNKNVTLGLISSLAEQGIATIAINAVGHGSGSLGRLRVETTDGREIKLPSGGRSQDVNGDGMIGTQEGFSAGGLIDNRDGLRQTVADLMQLVHVIRGGGMDVDGDGKSDLDGARVFYTGISLGGIYGTMLLGVEGDIRAGVPNVAGGPGIEIARLSQAFRNQISAGLGARTPSLLNALPAMGPQAGFNENFPLRNQPPVINNVRGAIEIQDLLDVTEWVTISGSPVAYAPHIIREPLAGNQPKPLIFQFARTDQVVPNPTSSAVIRAGGFQDRVTLFRNDLFISGLMAMGTPAETVNPLKNPHGFLGAPPLSAGGPNALMAGRQIAMFFASNGMTTIDPDGTGPIFETPIAGALPEDTAFIP